MAVLTNRVHRHEPYWVTVDLYGDHGQMYHNPQVLTDTIDTAVSMGADADKVCVMVPARDDTKDHFQKLLPASATTNLQDRVWADAVWTKEPNAAVVLPTADCQSIIFKNLITGMMVVAHGGRPAMTPGHVPEYDWHNIVDICIAKAVEKASFTNVRIFVTGAISGKHYWHENPGGQKAVQPFRRLYGEEVFYGNPSAGRLDLVSVTRQVLCRWKVPENQLIWDELCTYEHPHLASNRQGVGSGRNVTIAVNKPVQLD